jgi:hypothetical protein
MCTVSPVSALQLDVEHHASSTRRVHPRVTDYSLPTFLSAGLGTKLRKLQLSASSWPRSNQEWFGSFLQQLLPKLTALTELFVAGVLDSCVLNHAPAQLVVLECSPDGAGDK